MDFINILPLMSKVVMSTPVTTSFTFLISAKIDPKTPFLNYPMEKPWARKKPSK